MRNALNLLIVILLSCTSCSKEKTDESCIYYRKSNITEVIGEKTGQTNDNIPIELYFRCDNGCGDFGYFNESISKDTITVQVVAKYAGCICTKDRPVRKTIYYFNTSEEGTYHFRFFQSENQYTDHTIVVE